MSVSIKYKGAEIASASTDTTKTIKTAGKYCEADILVENTPDGGDAPVINPLSVTANGTYTAPSGVDGYSPVTVNVPQGVTPSGSLDITENGTYDVTEYAEAVVDVSGGGGGGGEVDDTFLAKSIEQMLSDKGFSKIEFTNASINSNITLSHSLGYAPQTFIMVPKSTANLASNRYYAGICTNPSDQSSVTNNTALVRITGMAEHHAVGGITADSNFETVVGKQFFDLPYIYLIGLFTFIVSSTNNNFVIRNGNQVPTDAAAGNALGSGDFVIFFK